MHRLLALALPVAAAAQPGAPDVQSALNELFNNGQLAGMDVSGSVSMETGTDLSLKVTTLIENNGFGLETQFSIKDGRCDFREVELGAKASITLPNNIERVLRALGLPSTITVADETRKIDFLPGDATQVLDTQSLDISDLAGSTTKNLLERLGLCDLHGQKCQVLDLRHVVPTLHVCECVGPERTAVPELCGEVGVAICVSFALHRCRWD